MFRIGGEKEKKYAALWKCSSCGMYQIQVNWETSVNFGKKKIASAHFKVTKENCELLKLLSSKTSHESKISNTSNTHKG